MKSGRFCAVLLCLLLFLILYYCEKKIYPKETMFDSGVVERKDSSNDKGEVSKTVYLTFDDGPSRNTGKVLEILREYDINATFFLIASQITPEYEEVVKRITASGNAIGVHTYSHEYGSIYKNTESYIDDFNLARERIEEVTDSKPKIYRFPGGSHNCYLKEDKKDIINRLSKEGYTYYDWNVSGEDSVGKATTESIYENVIKDVADFDEPVILLHDSSINDNTVKVLPQIIEYIKEKGYTFKTLGA